VFELGGEIRCGDDRKFGGRAVAVEATKGVHRLPDTELAGV
jgi:hypothetical protein